jgi:thiamine-monophosphate kinase
VAGTGGRECPGARLNPAAFEPVAEFDLIRLIREAAGPGGDGLRLGIGDDAAVLAVPGGREAVVTTDTLNAGIHFFDDADPLDVGYKALAVNLSDLAAMGAEPRWALLSLSLPEPDEAWVREFIAGFMEAAREHGVALAGGDTCAGHLSVTATAIGLVEPGRALTRSGAKPGDLLVVSGTPGLAALALEQLREGTAPQAEAAAALARPVPRVALGAALVGKASACIDISDGLLADLGHIAEASGCGATIELDSLPRHALLADCEERRRWRLQLAGGDDYELCFTLPPDQVAVLGNRGSTKVPRLTIIGAVDAQAGVRCRRPTGESFEPGRTGFEHFT